VDQFCELVDQLKAYSKDTNLLYYTTSFIDGLKDDIKSVILVQRPPDLDIACYLAQLQEETTTASLKFFKKIDTRYSSRPSSGPLPLPRPPPQPKNDNFIDEKSIGKGHKPQSMEEKVVALAAYRMAKGLCRRCGEKWSKTHKCATSMQLNALQEVWDLLEPELNIEQPFCQSESDFDQICLAISEAALSGK
jgi:hypothetical protein